MNAGTLNIYTGELVLEITEKMHAQLGPLSIQASDIDIDPKKIKTVLRQAWWAPAKNRLYLLNRVGDLVQFTSAMGAAWLGHRRLEKLDAGAAASA